MSVVKELIRAEKTGEISFGNYELAQKEKVEDFKFGGDIYKVKTYKDITKLEKNGSFVYESVPGTAVTGLVETEEGMKFTVEGTTDAQITVELGDEAEYAININGEETGSMKTNLGGKVTISVELNEGEQSSVIITRK
ncbi:MAG: endosialidase [Lachnospiraceae bacterium]|nr:endosialidase [Lachnospiraceae bacterium]